MQTSPLDQPITGMTYRQLRALIAEEVRALITGSVEKDVQGYLLEPDPDVAAEALRWLHENRWTPPPGSPTTFEMIRQNRDQ